MSVYVGDKPKRDIVAIFQLDACVSACVGEGLYRRPGLVDKDQAFGIEIGLAVEPGLAPLQDVGAVLLGRVRRLFLRVIAWRAKKRRIVL